MAADGGLTDYHDLKKRQFPPKERVLGPIEARYLVMAHSWRGSGKTWFVLSAAYVISIGREFLGWQAPKPRRVLIVDGEMGEAALQERLKALEAAADREPAEGFLTIWSIDTPGRSVPNISNPERRWEIETEIKRKGIEVLILDSLSTLTGSGGEENSSDSFAAIQAWLVKLKGKGVTVILMHHDGKNFTQRGTSNREDALGLTIHLKQPADYRQSDGCRFEVHFPKHRGSPDEFNTDPFEARLTTNASGAAIWTRRPIIRRGWPKQRNCSMRA